MSLQPLHLAPRKFEAVIGLGVALVVIAGSLYPLPAVVAVRLRRSPAPKKSGVRRFAAGLGRMLRGGDIVIRLDDVKYDTKALRSTIDACMAASEPIDDLVKGPARTAQIGKPEQAKDCNATQRRHVIWRRP